MNRSRMIPGILLSTLIVLGAAVAPGFAPGQAQTAEPPAAGGPERGDLFPGLLDAIQSTPGCLGLETARTSSGKNVIFAWFKDKQAVKKWYYSDHHMGAMEQFFGKTDNHDPLADVPDDSGPLMVIASITMADRQSFEATNLPISQIAIETYTPVTGGLFLGGRFAPDSVDVPNMKDYTP